MGTSAIKALFIICISFFPCITCVYGQTFFRAYGGPSQEFFYHVLMPPGGGYLAVGRTFSFGTGGWENYVVRTNDTGDTLWTRTYGNVLYDEVQAVDTVAGGGYILAGHTTTWESGGDLAIVRIDANGTLLWSQTYGGVATKADKAYSVKQTTDGGFIVCGNTQNFGAVNDDVYVMKLTAGGAVTWTKVVGTAGANEAGREVIQTSDGGYIVAGYSDGFGASFYDVYVIKLTSAGVISWQKTYGGSSYDFAYTIQQTTDGGYIVGATTNSFVGAGTDWNNYLLKLDVSGNVTWSKIYSSTLEDRTQCAKQTADGGYVLVGRTKSYGFGNFDISIIKTNSTGTILWSKAFGSTGDDQAWYVRQTPDLGYIMAGYTAFGTGLDECFLMKTDASGSAGCDEVTISTWTTTTPATVVNSVAGTQNAGGTTNGAFTALRVPADVITTRCFTVLPSELLSFSGMTFPGGVRLDWAYTSSGETPSFSLERAAEKEDFTRIPVDISRITAAGQLEYMAFDALAIPGHYQYRLRMTFLDGEETFSEVFRINTEIQNGEYHLFTSGKWLFIEASPYDLKEVFFSLTETGGREVLPCQLISGNGATPVSFDLSHLPEGIYIAELKTTDSRIRKKIVLLN